MHILLRKMSKYRNVITVVDNIKFHSKKESEKYEELKLSMYETTPESVKSFKLQPRFTVHDGFSKNGNKYGKITYVADFDVYYKDGTREIIDIKPFDEATQEFLLTDVFRIKQKLFDKKYPDLNLVIE